ncbi:MAG: 3-oxoacyl-[acyl-carrier-protein] synthase III C-terminal domain-containing protein [Puniceicoccaceae bacterium]
MEALPGRASSLLKKVLCGPSGIDKRHFATDDPGGLLGLSAEGLYRYFEDAAPNLAMDALGPALDRAECAADELDALFVCTCSGYLCPGLSSYLAERAGLRRDVYLADFVGLGCGAAVPTLRSASGFCSLYPRKKVAVVAVEVCSAAFYLDADPGVLISLCLFGDGAAASIWSSEEGGYPYAAGGFDTIHFPEKRQLLRFENSGGKLRNLLHKSVPEHAAEAVAALWARYEGGKGAAKILAHSGGRDVVEAVEAKLEIGPLESTRRVLKQYGNMSSPSVLFALEDYLAQGGPAEDLWLTSFGAGFACHSFALSPNGGD